MASRHETRPLAVVTGASSGIGRELARLAAEDGHDLVIAADEGPIEESAEALRALGGDVDAVECDLSTAFGVDKLILAIGGRRVDVLVANAGHGLARGFLDAPFAEARHVIDTNVTGTLDLIHRVGGDMRRHGRGRILITGSGGRLVPGMALSVYDGSKAFIDAFSAALRDELRGSGVGVTCLMPGPTETHFFARADMPDPAGTKADPADVARDGWDALLRGDDHVVSGWHARPGAAASRGATAGGVQFS